MLTIKQMKALEREAQKKGIFPIDLMENAGKEVAKVVREKYDPKHIAIFCGNGNNGGDGFVAARYFAENSSVIVFFFGDEENLTEEAKENYDKLKKDFPDYIIVPCSAEAELALKEADKHGIIKYIPGENKFEILQPEKLNEKQTKALEFVKENLLDIYSSTGVQEVMNKAVFNLLRYIALFPAGDKLADANGNVLPDCFLMPPGTTAVDFAFHLHTDLGNNFVRAVDIRTKQSMKKDAPLKHRDMIEILHSK